MSHILIAQSSGSSELSKLQWIEGKWERQETKPGQSAFEHWWIQNSGYQGEGVSMRGSDTVFVEKLSIRQKNGTLYYVAEVSDNAKSTYFKITQISESGFICENFEHDFPKKIEYQLESEARLRAVISGDGKSIPFIFRKVSN